MGTWQTIGIIDKLASFLIINFGCQTWEYIAKLVTNVMILVTFRPHLPCNSPIQGYFEL